jgi:hypothetical protein
LKDGTLIPGIPGIDVELTSLLGEFANDGSIGLGLGDLGTIDKQCFPAANQQLRTIPAL